ILFLIGVLRERLRRIIRESLNPIIILSLTEGLTRGLIGRVKESPFPEFISEELGKRFVDRKIIF
ncbi:MAG: hypothetical protein ABIK81_01505, partial [candidate division WOR-3 bacterium]